MKLTNRQVHILQLVAKGFPVKKIARILNVSCSAIEKSLIRVRTTLGAKNIANAIYIASKIGLVCYAGFIIGQTDNLRRCQRPARREQSSCILSQEVA